jgi:uncharacterized membrane protein
VLLPAISGALLLLVLALPDLGPSTEPGVVSAYHGRIIELLDPHRPDPSGGGSGFLPNARVLLLEGPDGGGAVEAYLEGPGGQQDVSGYQVGDDVLITSTETGDGDPYLAVTDRWRLPQIAILGLVFALAVVAAAGWRGLRALLALALTLAVVIRVLIPLIVQGVPPIPVAVVLGTAITILTIGLTEGFSRTSVAAILGTAGALALTALLAAAAVAALAFSNAVGSELIYLQTPAGNGLDLRGLLLAAFIFGAIGVLDDVTVTQAATVEGLAAHADLRGRRLFTSAFDVGRSHIAATVNTLFLAYLGASLPLMVLFVVSQQPAGLVVNGELVAIEIVRTLIGSLGIVAAVPLTTLIAVWLATGDRPLTAGRVDAVSTAREAPVGRLAAILGVGLLSIGLVTAGVAVAMAPLIATSPRAAVIPDQFGGTPAPSVEASPPARPRIAEGQPGDPPIVEVGTAMPVVDGPDALGTVTVVQHRVEDDGAGASRLVVEVRYDAAQAFPIRSEAWIASPLEGDSVVAEPATREPGLPATTLLAGESLAGWIEFDIPGADSDVFLDYSDQFGQTLFLVGLF